MLYSIGLFPIDYDMNKWWIFPQDFKTDNLNVKMNHSPIENSNFVVVIFLVIKHLKWFIYLYIFIYWFEKKNVIGNLNINCGFYVLQLFRWIYNKDGARAPRDVDGRAIYTTNCANRHASSFSKSAIILIVTLNWHIVQPELQMNICVIMNIVWWWMCLVIIIQMLRVCWRLKDMQVN